MSEPFHPHYGGTCCHREEEPVQENNFPPCPPYCCVEPCFYHDIEEQIEEDQQGTCKRMFCLWQYYVVCLLINAVTGLVALCTGHEKTFGLGLLYVLLLPSCSFIFWYRPLYVALMNDSSFHYLLFAFGSIFKLSFTLMCTLGISSIGTCGWINALEFAIGEAKGNSSVIVLFFISALFFTFLLMFEVLLLAKIHTMYKESRAEEDEAGGNGGEEEPVESKDAEEANAQAEGEGEQSGSNEETEGDPLA